MTAMALVATMVLAGCATNGDVEKVQGEFVSYRDKVAAQQAVQDQKIAVAQQTADDALIASQNSAEVTSRALEVLLQKAAQK